MKLSRQTILGIAGILILAYVVGCAGRTPSGEIAFVYKDLPVASGSAAAGEGHAVIFAGSPLKLEGTGIEVGDRLRDVQVTKEDLSLINIADTRGQVRIISVVPSLDTPVCEQQTHYLSEKNKGLDTRVVLITVSVDTPFAQRRFAQDAKIFNVTFLSDYRGGAFGKTYGLLLTQPHLLARTVMVVDKDNVVRYMQVTPELPQMPDMEAAFRAAWALL